MVRATTATTRAATPMLAAMMRPLLGLPCNANSDSARIGKPSLTKLFQMPATTSETEVREREKPHEPNIEYVNAIPIAPPPGRVLATAVEDSVATKACRYVNPGVAPTITNR
jgi:hypothetical protein